MKNKKLEELSTHAVKESTALLKKSKKLLKDVEKFQEIVEEKTKKLPKSNKR